MELGEFYKDAVRALRHDARNLLNGVTIISEHYANTDDAKSKQFAQYLEEKVTAMVRLGERADQLADIGEAQLVDQDTEELLQIAVDRMEADNPQPELVIDQAALRCDPELAAMAIEEVLRNALATNAPVKVRASDDTVTVSDEGRGIPEPAMPMLMTPFRGAKRAGGSSLGLPIAKAAMEAQGGSLDVQTTDGEGTIITLRFPKA